MAKDKDKEKEYKAEGVRRMRLRKQKRFLKAKETKRYKHANATWYEDGKCVQNCEMGGTCEYPCNGDC